MLDFNPRPWHVSLEEYQDLVAVVKPDHELIQLSIKLSKRLGVHNYGHVAAYLYRSWAHAQGKEKTLEWWREYHAWFNPMQEPEQLRCAAVPNDAVVSPQSDFFG